MRKRSQGGVTLVELVMAMVILLAISIPAAAMVGAQIRGMIASTDLTGAGNLARREMERLHNISYASLASGSSTIAAYHIVWTVVTVAGANGAERKDITMTAKRTGTSDILVTLYASIAKDVTYAP